MEGMQRLPTSSAEECCVAVASRHIVQIMHNEGLMTVAALVVVVVMVCCGLK